MSQPLILPKDAVEALVNVFQPILSLRVPEQLKNKKLTKKQVRDDYKKAVGDLIVAVRAAWQPGYLNFTWAKFFFYYSQSGNQLTLENINSMKEVLQLYVEFCGRKVDVMTEISDLIEYLETHLHDPHNSLIGLRANQRVSDYYSSHSLNFVRETETEMEQKKTSTLKKEISGKHFLCWRFIIFTI